MARLIYSAIASLDGYVADSEGNFDWAAPDEEVHTFVNDLEWPVGTYLYGRRMYETMLYWETARTVAGQPDFVEDFTELWQAADKVVYSRTLERPSSTRTRIEQDFDPGEVRRMKADMSARHHDRRSRARLAGLSGGIGRRLPPVHHAHRRGRRQIAATRSRAYAARAARRSPFPKWDGLPALRQPDLTRCRDQGRTTRSLLDSRSSKQDSRLRDRSGVPACRALEHGAHG